MRKVIVVGDTHGRVDWKAIVTKEEPFDTIVFIGDYFDSFDIKYEDQESNFLDILQYKESNPDKVKLLIGNHDFHYLAQAKGEHYSGYQTLVAKTINKIMQPLVDDNVLQMCYKEGNILFTHAGVSDQWLNESGLVDSPEIERDISKLWKDRPERFGFLGLDRYGDNPWQSPTWIRPRSLLYSPLPGYIQIVGHTRMKDIAVSPDKTFYFIDVLEENSKKYLSIIDNEIKIEQYGK